MIAGAERRLRIFLAHSSGDKPYVRAIKELLQLAGYDPWLDEDRLLAGQNWQLEVEKAVKEADAIAILLSNQAVDNAGYLHKEMALALDVAQRQPESALYRIPIRLDGVEPPQQLSHLHWIDLSGFAPVRYYRKVAEPESLRLVQGFAIGEGFLKLHNALLKRSEQLNLKSDGLLRERGRYLIHGRRPDGGVYFGIGYFRRREGSVLLEAEIAGAKFEYVGLDDFDGLRLSGPHQVWLTSTSRSGCLAGTWGDGGLEELIPVFDFELFAGHGGKSERFVRWISSD